MQYIFHKTSKIFLLCLFFLLASCEEQQTSVSATDHLDLARLYYKQGAFKSSLIEGRNAISKEPKNTEILTTMAKVLLKLNNSTNAIDLIKQAVEIEKDNTEFKLLLTKAYLLNNNIKAAKEILDSLDSSLLKANSEYLKLTADYYLRNGEYKQAIDWYSNATQSDSNKIEAILGISKAYLLLKDKIKAREFSEAAYNKAPTDIDTLSWKARLHMMNNEYIEAEKTLSRAMIEVEKYDILTAEKYAIIDMLAKSLVAQGKIEESFTYSNYLAQSSVGKIKSSYENALNLVSEKNIEDAETAFENILKQAPGHKSSGILLGLIRFEKGDYKEADEILSKFAADENSPIKGKKALALTKIRLNKIDEAIRLLNKVLKDNEDDADLHALLAEALLRNKQNKASIVSIKKALEIKPDNANYLSILALAYQTNKEFGNAIQAATKALKKKPGLDKARQILISSYALNNNLSQARKEIDQWLKTKPNHVLALSISASLYQQQNNPNNAKQQFSKILNIDPSNNYATANMIRYSLTDKDTNKAYRFLNTLINNNPDDINALDLLLKVTAQTRNITKAINILEDFNTNNPLSTNAKLSLAQLYLTDKQTEKALSVIDQLTQIDAKNTGAYILKARALARKNNTEAVLENYKLASSFSSNNPIPLTEISQHYLSKKDYKNAIKSAEQALTINPKYLKAHILLIQSAIELNNNQQASNAISKLRKVDQNSGLADELEGDLLSSQQQYQKAVELYNTAWDKRKSVPLANKLKATYLNNKQPGKALIAWKELANQNANSLPLQVSYSVELYNMKEFNQAKSLLEKLVNKHPKNLSLLNNLASVYLELNDDRALSIAQKAYAIDSRNPAVMDTLGWIYSKQHQDYNKAIPLLKNAFSIMKADEIKQHLTETLNKAGKTDEAKQYQ